MKLCCGSVFALLFRHMVGSCLKQLLKLFVIHHALFTQITPEWS
jgi:hypothetical protein